VIDQFAGEKPTVVIYLDRDMEFVWTLKHLHKTSWQWSSSAQIKSLQPKFLSFQ